MHYIAIEWKHFQKSSVMISAYEQVSSILLSTESRFIVLVLKVKRVCRLNSFILQVRHLHLFNIYVCRPLHSSLMLKSIRYPIQSVHCVHCMIRIHLILRLVRFIFLCLVSVLIRHRARRVTVFQHKSSFNSLVSFFSFFQRISALNRK